LAKVHTDSWVLLELKTELPNGFNDIQQILSRIKDYDPEIWEEHYYREPNRRGQWSYTRFEVKLWVDRKKYQPLANRLGKLSSLKYSLKRIAPF